MLNRYEIQTFEKMKAAAAAPLVSMYLKEIEIHKNNPNHIKRAFISLLDHYQDNPQYITLILGFDLPKALNVKLYTTDGINRIFSESGVAYRAIERTTYTDKEAKWAAPAGFFNLPEGTGTVYVDSLLNRYVRLSNGQVFECSNADLRAMPDQDKKNILAYLTGLID